MATPAPVFYAVASGATMLGGRTVPPPAWLAGKALNEWMEIPGTASPARAHVEAYSGMCVRTINSEVLIAAAGGHHDSFDNGVYGCVIGVDSPGQFTARMAGSNFSDVVDNVAYWLDGKPAARHNYYGTQYNPTLDKIFLLGTKYPYAFGGGGNYTLPDSNAFNLATNTWDPRYTWADVIPGCYGSTMITANNKIYARGQLFNPATNTWRSSSYFPRDPMAFDPVRNQLYALCFGVGEGGEVASSLASFVYNAAGTTQTAITFNASSAYTTFLADIPNLGYNAMEYDPDNDRFLYYCGQAGQEGRIYVIQPNGTTVWDMSLLTLVGAVRPVAATNSGVNNRFRYVPALKGFVLLARAASNMYFIKTAA
jgi:hypothetical protein